jgi:amino acid adenylation domain-containing protein
MNPMDEQQGAGTAAPEPGAGGLSYPQRRIWLVDRIRPGLPTFNVPQGLWLTGPVDLASLRWAVQQIVRRHEALRTVFPVVGGEPSPRILPSLTVGIPVVELPVAPGAWRTRAMERARSLAREPFRLDEPPLLRLTLISGDGERHLLVIVIHHMVCDGWSMGRFVAELDHLYTARVRHRDPSLPALPAQYRDFTAWQHRMLGRDHDDHLRFWREYLRDAPVDTDVPADWPRSKTQRFQGALHYFALPPATGTDVRKLAEQLTATPYMVMLAAFAILLSRYSGSADVVVGTPTSGRARPEFEDLIGYFGELMPLRADLSGQPTFAEVVRRVRRSALSAFDHQDLPFQVLAEEVVSHRDPSRHPLFSNLIVLQNFLPGQLGFGGLDAEPLEMDNGTAKADLYVTLGWRGQGLAGSVQYDTDLFSAERVRRLADHYAILLAAGAAAPDQHMGYLPLLTAQEAGALARSGLPAKPFRPVTDRLAQQARLTPDAPAVSDDHDALTFGELDEAASALASRLIATGTPAGATVGVSLRPGAHAVAALFGVMRAGAAFLPLDANYPPQRIAYMMADSAIDTLIADTGTPEHILGRAPRTLFIGEQAPAPRATRPVRPDGLAYVVYTSGSSGRPKGCEITHAGLANFIDGMRDTLRVRGSDVLLSVSPWSFDMLIPEIFLPLSAGARIVVAPRKAIVDGRRMLAMVRDHGVTFIHSSPRTWQLLAEAGLPAGLLRLGVCGAEAMPPGLASWLLSLGCELWHMYGPTEATAWSTGLRMRSPADARTIGDPLPGYRTCVLSADFQPVPPGAIGELFIGGVGLARGYRRQPGLTADRFLPDPGHRGERMYRTGDLVRQAPDGAIEFVGRGDQQVKVRGFRVELGEVERVLQTDEAVRNAVVVAAEQAGERQLVAYVEAADEAGFDAGALRERLGSQLPEPMIPVLVPGALPRLPNGKVDRVTLAGRPVSAPATGTSFVPPEGPVETMLADIWQEILSVGRVGRYDNFFVLGGNSITALRVATLAGERGFPLVPAEMFARQTVADLAAFTPDPADPAAESHGAEGPAAIAVSELAKLKELIDNRRD